MWNTSAQFKTELRKTNHTPIAKAVLLDTAFNPVQGGTIFTENRTNQITNFITDGSIDVDVNRGTRRTAEITLLNPTSEFTPATENFHPDGPWVGMIYLNRVVRMYRGVIISGDQEEYVPIGTFMVDNADVIVERNMSLVVLTMSDLWKKLSKSFRKAPKKYTKDTLINTIIKDELDETGASFPYAWNIDPLETRPLAERKITTAFKLEEGESRGEKIRELCNAYDIDIYFDPMGRLVTQDRKAPADRRSVWHFYSSEKSDGMLISGKRSFNDDNLYNHVIVIGTGNQKNTVRVERRDDNPASKTNIQMLGDRVFVHTDDKIKTVAQANKVLEKLWQLRFHITEVMECEVICNPALEGDDVVTITEREKLKVDANYRLHRFTIPLTTTRQTIGGDNIIRKENL